MPRNDPAERPDPRPTAREKREWAKMIDTENERAIFPNMAVRALCAILYDTEVEFSQLVYACLRYDDAVRHAASGSDVQWQAEQDNLLELYSHFVALAREALEMRVEEESSR